MEVAICIPCLNEEITLEKVIQDFRSELPGACIYVIDNASTDRSKEIALSLGATVIHEPRRGKGYVTRTIFEKINADIFVIVDGDDTYPARRVHDLITPIQNLEADMVVGARLQSHEEKSFRPFHRWGNELIKNLVNGIYGARLTDIMSGYRAMSRELVKTLPILSRGFEVETQLVCQALFYEFKIKEIQIHYSGRPAGSHSKLNTIKDGFRVLVTLFDISKAYRPLLVFFVGGLVFFLLGLGIVFFARHLGGFIESGEEMGLFLLGVTFLSSLFIATGVILDSLNFRLKELHVSSRVMLKPIFQELGKYPNKNEP